MKQGPRFLREPCLHQSRAISVSAAPLHPALNEHRCENLLASLWERSHESDYLPFGYLDVRVRKQSAVIDRDAINGGLRGCRIYARQYSCYDNFRDAGNVLLVNAPGSCAYKLAIGANLRKNGNLRHRAD